jgi:hypothetical protein
MKKVMDIFITSILIFFSSSYLLRPSIIPCIPSSPLPSPTLLPLAPNPSLVPTHKLLGATNIYRLKLIMGSTEEKIFSDRNTHTSISRIYKIVL